MLPTGNDSAREALAAAMSSGTLHHAWLLAGPQGVGKASFAHIAAARMLAEAAEPELLAPGWEVPDGTRTASYLAAGAHPDFRQLSRLPKDADKPDEALARSITIAQVRGLQAMFANKPSLSARRVILIDAVDDLERAAANALLKSLEEPPAGTIFLLISHAPGRLLPTIRSRCRLLRFNALSDAQVSEVVRSGLPSASRAEIEALVRAGEGSPGQALRFAGLDIAELEAEMEALATTGDISNLIRSRLSKALGAKTAQKRYEAFLARAPSFIAERARTRSGESLRTALDAYAAAQEVAGGALGLSLDASGSVYEISGIIARLAPRV